MNDRSVILGAARTPIGAFLGSLAPLTATQLGPTRLKGNEVLLIEVEIGAHGFEILDGRNRSMSERPRRSMAQAMTTSNFLRLASLSMVSRPGR